MAKAPICHIPPEDAKIPQPGAKTLPPIPNAVDLPSALMAINALRKTVQVITNQVIERERITNIRPDPDPNKKPQWNEVSRVVDTIRIYQNNDKSTGNFVEVEQINKLVMADKNTGQTWTWDRERK